MAVVLTRPIVPNEKSKATIATNAWAEDVVQTMRAGGLRVVDLGSQFTRSQLEEALMCPQVDTYIHYGHGLKESMLGYDLEPIIDEDNAHLLANKVIVSINCESARDLGFDAIEAGAKAYLGYTDKVWLKLNSHGVTYTGFKESNNAWNTLRLEGIPVTIGEAIDRMAEVYQFWIDVYDFNGEEEIACCLQASKDELLILGNDKAFLPEQNPVELLPYKAIYPKRNMELWSEDEMII